MLCVGALMLLLCDLFVQQTTYYRIGNNQQRTTLLAMVEARSVHVRNIHTHECFNDWGGGGDTTISSPEGHQNNPFPG